MPRIHCKHCGSQNHQAFDCPTPHLTWVPPPEVAAQIEAEREPEPISEPISSQPVFEEGERWPGAPRICTATNLPSHENVKAALQYIERYAPGLSYGPTVACDKCGGFHTSTPYSKLPYYVKPRPRDYPRVDTAVEMQTYVQPEKPKQELPKPVLKPKPVPKKVVGELF